jgi:photosystem II stability/assembly factor-like uncharacterized protein
VFSQIRVHPKNENEIYALGVSMAKSEDGGKTWKMFRPTDKSSEGIHGDNHAFWFDPVNPDRIILGNDGGVSTTFDGGKKWNNFFDKIPTTQFYTVTYDMQQPFNIFGAVQDEGTMSGSSANVFGKPQDSAVRHWMMAPGGEGTQIQVDPQFSNIVYSCTYYGRLMKSDMDKPDSLRATHFPSFDVGRIDSLRGEWLAGTLQSRFDRKVVYHGLQHLYKTTDEGEHWERISNDLSYNDKTRMGNYPYLIYHQAITAIAEADRPGQLYVGTDDGRVWYTPDDGKTWREISSGLPKNKHVIKISPSMKVAGRVYIALNDRREDNNSVYLYRSDDQGKTWRSISGDLPPSPANVIAEHPDDPTVLFCGTDMGVYMSKNSGKNWICLNANLPAAVSVNDLFIHPRDRKLVIGTYGRGVYILDDLTILK